jgi:hypothetical protein
MKIVLDESIPERARLKHGRDIRGAAETSKFGYFDVMFAPPMPRVSDIGRHPWLADGNRPPHHLKVRMYRSRIPQEHDGWLVFMRPDDARLVTEFLEKHGG